MQSRYQLVLPVVWLDGWIVRRVVVNVVQVPSLAWDVVLAQGLDPNASPLVAISSARRTRSRVLRPRPLVCRAVSRAIRHEIGTGRDATHAGRLMRHSPTCRHLRPSADAPCHRRWLCLGSCCPFSPKTGIEPSTRWLLASRSTTELSGQYNEPHGCAAFRLAWRLLFKEARPAEEDRPGMVTPGRVRRRLRWGGGCALGIGGPAFGCGRWHGIRCLWRPLG